MTSSDQSPVQFVPYQRAPVLRAIMRSAGRLGLAISPETTWITLGSRIYHPDDVRPSDEPEIVAHELVHVGQWRRWGPLFGIAYLLLPVPIGLAWCRWWSEREAYRVQLAVHPTLEEVDRLVMNLWTAYGWPWPRTWMRRWFRRELAAIQERELLESQPNKRAKSERTPPS